MDTFNAWLNRGRTLLTSTVTVILAIIAVLEYAIITVGDSLVGIIASDKITAITQGAVAVVVALRGLVSIIQRVTPVAKIERGLLPKR